MSSVYELLADTAAVAPHHPFLHIPASAARDYAAVDIDYSYAEILAAVDARADRYAAAGFTRSVFKDSQFGVGVSWGTPQIIDEDQIATEFFYRWQMAQNLALTPGIQFLFEPALNEKDDVVTVLGLRLRLTL